MAFDVQGALNAGYTPNEVAEYLGKEKNFDVSAARQSGYSNEDIINYLMPATKKEEGMLGSLKKGAEQFVSSGRTAVESLYKSPEEAALAAQKRGEEIAGKYGEGPSFEKLQKIYEEKGILPAAGEVARQIPRAILEQAPNIAATVASGGAGALLAGPVGAIAGAAVPSFIQQYGGNIERQAQAQQEAGKPLDISRGAAAAAAVPQAALDVAQVFIPFGGKIAGKVFGPAVGKMLKAGEGAAAEKLAKETLLSTVAKGTATGVLAELPTEITQQMLERAQAGLPLTDASAFKEYGETGFAISLLGPLGILGRISNKAEAGRSLALAQQQAAAKNEPQEVVLQPAAEPTKENPEPPLLLTYDPTVPTTRGLETFTVFPDGRIAPSEPAAFEERYKPISTIPSAEEEAFTKPLAPAEAFGKTQTVAMIEPDGTVKTYEGVPNKTNTGINLLDENQKTIKTIKPDRKTAVINPTEQDIFRLETTAMEQKLPQMRQAVESARIEANKTEGDFKQFLKDHPLQSQYYADLINPKYSKTRALTKNQLKGMFINSTEKGYHLDDLAAIAHDNGYLSDEEFYNPEDNGGMNAFSEKVAQAYDNQPVNTGATAEARARYQSLEDAYRKLDDEVQARKQQVAQFPTEEEEIAPEFVETTEAVPAEAVTPAEYPFREPVSPSYRAEVTRTPFTDKFLADQDAFYKTMRAQLNRMGLPNVALKFEDTLQEYVNGKLSPVNGLYFEKLIKVSLSGDHPERTLNHEALHAMKDLGFFTEKEWATLTAAAKSKWMKKYDIAEGYGKESEEIQIEEAIAHAFADYRTQPAPVKGIMSKIIDHLKKLGNFLRGRGYQTAEDIFGKAAEGKLSAPSPVDTPQFKKWFGSSKVVDDSGKPLQMYHGTAGEMFDAFDKEKIRPIDYDVPFNGFWFSSDRFTSPAMRDAQNVIPVYLSIKNPAPSNVWRQVAQQVNRDANLRNEARSENDEVRYRLQDMGYDGIHYSGIPKIDKKEFEKNGYTSFKDLAGRSYTISKNEDVGGVDLYGGKVNQKPNIETEEYITGYLDLNDFLNTFEDEVWVAFEPSQIKSSTENVGAFDEKSPSIRAEIPSKKKLKTALHDVDPAYAQKILDQFTQEPATVKEKMENLKKGFFDRMVTGLFDEFRAIKKYDNNAYMMARISKSIDGGLQGLLEYGQVFNDGGALNIRKGTKGLLDILKPLGSEVDQYQIWKALNRDANMPADKRSFDPALVAGRNKLAAGNLNGKPRKEVYEQALREENELNKSVLKVALDAGLIDQKGFDKFASDIYYIPFYKMMEDGDVASISAASKLTGQEFSKMLKGGPKKTNDLMENVLMNWSHILSAAMKNQAAVKTIQAAEMMDAATIAEPVNGKYPPNTVKVMRDGQVVHYELTDPDLVDAISTISYLGPKSAFLDVAKHFTNVLRYGITLSPAYKIRNLMRDSVQSAAISELSPNLFSNVYNGLAMSKEGHPTFMAALAGGGIFEMGVAHEGNQAKLIKRLIDKGVSETTILDSKEKIQSKLQAALDWYNEIGNKFENANRLALYQSLVDSGKTHLEASYAARDLMDFSMQGQFRAIKVIGSVVPFFNARLQGLYKLGRDGVTPTYRVICNATTGAPLKEGDKMKAMKFTTISSAVMMASVALYAMYKDDEDFQRREPWDRDNFWWFKIGDTQYRIPKPFEIGALGTIAERTYEQIVDENIEGKVFGERLQSMLANTFSMNPVPQMVKPLIDLYANTDSFTGAPIESAGMERLSKQERKTNHTSGLAIALGGVSQAAAKVLTMNPQAEGFSPVQMDYAIKAYFGWLGATAASTADLAVEPFQEGTKVHKPIVDTLAMGFVKTMPETQSRYMTEFYQNNANLQSTLADMRHYAELGDQQKVMDIMQSKGNDIALAKMYDMTAKRLAEMRKQVRLIETNQNIPPEERRAEMTRLQLLMSEMAKQAEEMRISLKK